MKRILVLGGAGVVGRHLVKALRKQNKYEVWVFDRVRKTEENYIRGDIVDNYSISKAFEEVQPQIVVHLAGMVSRWECEETPILAIQTNIIGMFNVCSLSLRYGARLLYSGTSEEYGSEFEGGNVVTEETPLGAATNVYCLTKRNADEMVHYFAHAKQLRATTMRFFMFYGIDDELTDYRCAITRFVHDALLNKTLQVHEGTERSWCYMPDAIEAIQKTIEREQKDNYEIFNIGNEERIRTEYLAEKIVHMANSGAVKLIPPEATITPIKRGSFNKAKRELDWRATTPLDVGLKNVICWMDDIIKDGEE
jgi:nucleoside-diphosphate-sugar epimerase